MGCPMGWEEWGVLIRGQLHAPWEGHLCKGRLRISHGSSAADKLWYCRLSPNHKVLHYGDVEEGVQSPPIESLTEKSR